MGNACSCDQRSTAVDDVNVKKVDRKPKQERLQRSAAASRQEPRKVDFGFADPSKWVYDEAVFGGGYHYHTKPEIEEVDGSIESGIEALKADPSKYEALYFQSSMKEWPVDQQKYKLVKRTGSGFGVKADDSGAFMVITAKYQALQPGVDIAADAFTESFQYGGKRLGSPLCPGRGSGVGDLPGLTIVRDADPSDISQGQVGDCWLLSAISALAEYEGAIRKLFRKTEGLENMPHDTPNEYIVSLYDVSTWQEVDVKIDERLCSTPEGKGLLGCTPSVDGELWTCYLEKAIAAHCGGWDKIDGGTCVHAFRILLGCKDQWTFRESDGGQWQALSAFNPNEKRMEKLANSPHDGFKGLWPAEWPELGGGGAIGSKVSADEMFLRMCAWEDAEFIMCCGTKSGSDSNDTDGIVDGHAYSILACEDNVAGSGFNLIKVRNPWGQGEFKSGKWDDDGPGWDSYPDVKAALNPVQANDGVFWLEQEEFFKYFKTVYLCAKDMREFIEG